MKISSDPAYLCIITKAPDTFSSVIKSEKFPLIVTTWITGPVHFPSLLLFRSIVISPLKTGFFSVPPVGLCPLLLGKWSFHLSVQCSTFRVRSWQYRTLKEASESRNDVVAFPGRTNALSFESDLCHLVGRRPLRENGVILMKQIKQTTYAPEFYFHLFVF